MRKSKIVYVLWKLLVYRLFSISSEMVSQIKQMSKLKHLIYLYYLQYGSVLHNLIRLYIGNIIMFFNKYFCFVFLGFFISHNTIHTPYPVSAPKLFNGWCQGKSIILYLIIIVIVHIIIFTFWANKMLPKHFSINQLSTLSLILVINGWFFLTIIGMKWFSIKHQTDN